MKFFWVNLFWKSIILFAKEDPKYFQDIDVRHIISRESNFLKSEKAEKLTILVKKIVKLQEETGHFSPIKSWLQQQGFLYCLPYWFQFLMLNGIQMITWKGSILLSNLIKVWKSLFLKSRKKLDFSFSKGSGFGVTNWDFLGNTMVTSSHVRLTANEQSQQGAIWNTKVSVFFILTKK